MNVNVVVITGNLTHDPVLSRTAGGTPVARLRVAVNGRRKDSQTGEWVDKPNFFNVTVWGNRGVACFERLKKGRPVAIEGRLDWSSWEHEDGSRREAVQIVADVVQFLGARPKGEEAEPMPTEAGELVAAGAGDSEDEIPF